MTPSRVDQILSALNDDGALPDTLPDRLCAMCAEELRMTGVGLVLITTAGHHGVVAATEGLATSLEALQFDLGEGPGIDASSRRRPALHPFLDRTAFATWHAFGPAALEAGAAAAFAFPLQLGGIRLGVLDLYRDTAGSLNSGQMREALAFADAAIAIVVQLQEEKGPTEATHPRLAEPLLDRPEIHQATGMVAVQASIGLVEALLLLRAHAFAMERSLVDSARDVVARRLRFSAEMGDND